MLLKQSYSFSWNADRAPQLKASVRHLLSGNGHKISYTQNILHSSIVLVAILIGGGACSLFRDRFIATGSSLESDYHIYRYRTPGSSDPEEITLYGDFRSAEVTRETFESNATTDAATLIERGYKFDEKGRRIGERVITVFKGVNAVRISWTEGDIFWSVQAPSLELAREFEASEIVHSITMSNKRLQPTPR
jgi:hypothetical protein